MLVQEATLEVPVQRPWLGVSTRGHQIGHLNRACDVVHVPETLCVLLRMEMSGRFWTSRSS